jgi:hypothetical protein
MPRSRKEKIEPPIPLPESAIDKIDFVSFNTPAVIGLVAVTGQE